MSELREAIEQIVHGDFNRVHLSDKALRKPDEIIDAVIAALPSSIDYINEQEGYAYAIEEVKSILEEAKAK